MFLEDAEKRPKGKTFEEQKVCMASNYTGGPLKTITEPLIKTVSQVNLTSNIIGFKPSNRLSCKEQRCSFKKDSEFGKLRRFTDSK